jgi:competence protein ComEC
VRPLTQVSIAFALGIVVEPALPAAASGWGLPAVAAMVTAIQWALLHRGAWRPPALPLLSFFTLGLLAARLSAPQLPAPTPLLPFLETPQTLFLAEVAALPEPVADKVRLDLRLERALTDQGSFPLVGMVSLKLDECRGEWQPGEFVLARLTLRPFRGFKNPGAYDYERAQAERGLYASAFAADDRLLVKVGVRGTLPGAHAWSLVAPLERFRRNALQWLQASLPAPAAAIDGALLLGFRTQIGRDTEDEWNRAGVTHLLSISGQHLGLVALAAFWLLRRLARVPSVLLERTSDQHLALWGALGVSLTYAALGGLALPTWRSAIMLTLFFLALSVDRASDLVSALAAAALIILALWPASLRQPSFQLSFAALGGIFLLYPRFARLRAALWRRAAARAALRQQRRQWLRLLAKPFVEAFWVSLAANTLVVPLVAYHFHGISLVGLAANAVVVPLVGFAVLPLGLLSLGLFALHPGIASLAIVPQGWAVDLCQRLISWCAGLSWAYLWVGDLSLPVLIGLYSLLALALFPRRRAAVLAAAACGGCVLCIGAAFPGARQPDQALTARFSGDADRSLKVMVVDVGQGSSTLLRFPGGTTVLVDGGGFHDDSFDVGRNVVAPLLWHLGVKRLDAVALSHGHPDHGNGLRFILRHFRVGSFWEGTPGDAATVSGELAAIARRRAIPILCGRDLEGERWFGPCRLLVRQADPAALQRSGGELSLNNRSLVFQVDYGETHAVLPGDIDQATERLLFAASAPVGQVLLVAPHHGSNQSNSPWLIERLHPEEVIFSCGHENWFGFPHPAVLDRYQRAKTRLWRTDRDGAVLAVSDGSSWSFHTAVARSE